MKREERPDARRALKLRYADLVVCRLLVATYRAFGNEQRVAFYREEGKRTRRVIETLRKPAEPRRVVFPEIRAEALSWHAAMKEQEEFERALLGGRQAAAAVPDPVAAAPVPRGPACLDTRCGEVCALTTRGKVRAA